jgi:predicted outer membrane repeat protein
LNIQGTGSNRVFIGHLGNTISISNLTISNATDATQGGGVYNAGTLTLDRIVFENNTAPSGGAIYNQGTVTITNSTLAHNHATSGAGIYNTGTLSMTNVTLGNNTATGQGGGIYNASSGTITLLHASVVDNPGGGVYNKGTLNYTSTVIAKNGAAGDCTLSGGSVGTNVTNFVGTATCSASLNGNPLLSGLGSAATEPLDTFAPFSASPLLDAANAGTCPAADERGVARPIGTGCDIGAFEGNLPSVTINQAAGQVDPTASGPILFTVIFGDPVTGFAANDIVLSGTATGTLVPVVTEIAPNDGTTYQVSVTGMSGTGTVIATIISGAAVNTQGNANGSPFFTDHTVTYDVTAPTVTVDQSTSGPVQNDPTKSSTIYFWVTFSEPVTGLTGSDFSFTGSTVSGTLSVASLQGSGALYLVGISGMTSGGLVVVSLPANQATDLAGNLNAASTSTDNTVTYAP